MARGKAKRAPLPRLVQFYCQAETGSVEIHWTTAAGIRKTKTLTWRARKFINDHSGLLGCMANNYYPILGNGTNNSIARRLEIPVHVLVAYQAHFNIDIKERQRAYQEAIKHAIAEIKRGFPPVDSSGTDAVPMDPFDMLL